MTKAGIVIIRPAPWYARELNNDPELTKKAWLDGRDFRIGDTGPYCSSKDFDLLMESFEIVLIEYSPNCFLNLLAFDDYDSS